MIRGRAASQTSRTRLPIRMSVIFSSLVILDILPFIGWVGLDILLGYLGKPDGEIGKAALEFNCPVRSLSLVTNGTKSMSVFWMLPC
jgi:hypothetical protein